MKLLVLGLLLAGSSAMACPTLSGTFKGQYEGETVEYKQIDCSNLELIGYIDGTEYARKAYLTDGTVVENDLNGAMEKLACAYSAVALECKSELFDDQGALIDTLMTKEFINANNNLQVDFVYFTAAGDKETGSGEMERVSP